MVLCKLACKLQAPLSLWTSSLLFREKKPAGISNCSVCKAPLSARVVDSCPLFYLPFPPSLHHYLGAGVSSILIWWAGHGIKTPKLCYRPCKAERSTKSPHQLRNSTCLAHGGSLACFTLQSTCKESIKKVPPSAPRLELGPYPSIRY